MPWRIINHANHVWHVQPAAERRAHQSLWQLMLSFRAVDTDGERRVVWASYPIESTTKSTLFTQAEKISDQALRDLLIEHQP
ncbi:MAG: hypothetical protein WD934_08185 [Gemmatimonadales bacterium]|jgi:hypothetical protein